jgi:hypothetical protein
MTQRPEEPALRPNQWAPEGDTPPPDVVAFIRFCHRRRQAGWPELYDEMCAVASRREFKGWGHDQLAAHGLAFSLQETHRLAGWVRTVLALADEGGDEASHRGAGTPRHHHHAVGV